MNINARVQFHKGEERWPRSLVQTCENWDDAFDKARKLVKDVGLTRDGKVVKVEFEVTSR